MARTRLRQAPGGGPGGGPKYTGLFQCLRLVWVEEGLVGLYGGLTPHLMRTIPSAALLVMPKCGHTLNLEDPDVFNRAVLDFVTQVDGGTWRNRNPAIATGSIFGTQEG